MQDLPMETINTIFKCLEGYAVSTNRSGFINGQGERILLIEAKKTDEPQSFEDAKKNEIYRWILILNNEITYLSPGAYQMLNDITTDHQQGHLDTPNISCKSNSNKRRRLKRNDKPEIAVVATLNKETGNVDVDYK